MYGREGTLLAQSFDATRAQTTGDPIPIVAEHVEQNPHSARAAFAVSETGVLAYRSRLSQTTRLVWRDRSGRELETLGQPGFYRNPRLSPDGARVAVELFDNPSSQNRDLWLADAPRGAFTRFTFESRRHAGPVWSPDGSRIAFVGGPVGSSRLYQKPTSGPGKEELLLKEVGDWVVDDWIQRDDAVVYHEGGVGVGAPGLRVLRLAEGGADAPSRLEARVRVTHIRVSPDGKWAAYTSFESGRPEVYIQHFPTPVRKWLISTAGGNQPVWRRDGRELFYADLDNRLMAIPITLGATVESGASVPLFELRAEAAGGDVWHQYDVTPDAQRFLVNMLPERAAAPPITVVVNWPALLKK